MRNSVNVTSWSISDAYSFSNSIAPLFRQYPPIFWALGVLGSYSSATEVPLTKCTVLEFLQNSLTSFSVMVSEGWFSWCSRCCTHLNTTSESLAAWLWYLESSKNTYISYFQNLTPCRYVNETHYLFILSFQMKIYALFHSQGRTAWGYLWIKCQGKWMDIKGRKYRGRCIEKTT